MEARIQPTFGFCIFAALCLLRLPFPWLMGVLTASFVHEAFHCIAVWLLGGQVRKFTLSAGGARIEATYLPPRKALLCALAGPLGSFSLLALSEYLPEAAVCGFIQGAYNLMPIFPLDGGRAIRILLPHPADTAVEVFFLTLFTGLSLAIGICQPDLGCIFLFSLWFPVVQRKFSCKEAKQAVQ